MKKSVIAIILILLAAAGTAYYFLKQAELPLNGETMQYIEGACITESRKFLSEPDQGITSTEGCKKLPFARLACEARLRGRADYAESGQLENDCAQLALFEAFVESNDRRNCNKLQKDILKEECTRILG